MPALAAEDGFVVFGNATTDRDHAVRPAVICAASAVFRDGPAEIAERQDENIVHLISSVELADHLLDFVRIRSRGDVGLAGDPARGVTDHRPLASAGLFLALEG